MFANGAGSSGLVVRVADAALEEHHDEGHADSKSENDGKKGDEGAGGDDGCEPERGVTLSSQYRGVSWDKQKRKYQARINVCGRDVQLGCFANELEAARAYDNAARQHFGGRVRLARLNFLTQEEEEIAGDAESGSAPHTEECTSAATRNTRCKAKPQTRTTRRSTMGGSVTPLVSLLTRSRRRKLMMMLPGSTAPRQQREVELSNIGYRRRNSWRSTRSKNKEEITRGVQLRYR
jgi:hypothetical protein